MTGIVKHVNFAVVKCVILASPGFVNQQVLDYMMKTAQAKEIKEILSNKEKFMLVHSSSGHKYVFVILFLHILDTL